jgi:uncharacterized protein YgbK (DUF1537 family)
MSLIFAAVADDDTGASDLAGMLAEQGLRTLLILDLPSSKDLMDWSRDAEAIVMAEGTRSIEAKAAYQRTRAAIRLLAPLQPQMLEIKYCSTFDSTPAGNIGPTIDAALDELGEDFTIALPALPVNGRTTYMGYHFVREQLLSDSPMRHHPLTPMTNPNLVEFLGLQTRRRVGLAPCPVVEAGPEVLGRHFEKLRSAGVAIAVVDCLNDRHLETICRASAGLRLITGSSAPGMKLPTIWRERGWRGGRGAYGIETNQPTSGCLFVAGSCSVATRGQNQWLTEQGVHAIRLDVRQFPFDAAVDAATGELKAGRNCLITTSAEPPEVEVAQAWAEEQGLTRETFGLEIVTALARLTREIVETQPPAALVVAGGETAGAICRHLDLGAFQVGPNIEPGVPLCHSLGHFRLPVILKSGNFGSPDFYGRALQAIYGHSEAA